MLKHRSMLGADHRGAHGLSHWVSYYRKPQVHQHRSAKPDSHRRRKKAQHSEWLKRCCEHCRYIFRHRIQRYWRAPGIGAKDLSYSTSSSVTMTSPHRTIHLQLERAVVLKDSRLRLAHSRSAPEAKLVSIDLRHQEAQLLLRERRLQRLSFVSS